LLDLLRVLEGKSMYVGIFVEGGVSASVTEGESISFSEECNGSSERCVYVWFWFIHLVLMSLSLVFEGREGLIEEREGKNGVLKSEWFRKGQRKRGSEQWEKYKHNLLCYCGSLFVFVDPFSLIIIMNNNNSILLCV